MIKPKIKERDVFDMDMSVALKLIAIEGLDNVGKGAIIEGTLKRLKERYPDEIFHVIPFPNKENELTKLAFSRDNDNIAYFAMLSSNLMSFKEQVLPLLKKGEWVIVDRYLWSNIVYQTMGLLNRIGVLNKTIETENNDLLVGSMARTILYYTQVLQQLSEMNNGLLGGMISQSFEKYHQDDKNTTTNDITLKAEDSVSLLPYSGLDGLDIGMVYLPWLCFHITAPFNRREEWMQKEMELANKPLIKEDHLSLKYHAEYEAAFDTAFDYLPTVKLVELENTGTVEDISLTMFNLIKQHIRTVNE
jgi:dTMP kinase